MSVYLSIFFTKTFKSSFYETPILKSNFSKKASKLVVETAKLIIFLSWFKILDASCTLSYKL